MIQHAAKAQAKEFGFEDPWLPGRPQPPLKKLRTDVKATYPWVQLNSVAEAPWAKRPALTAAAASPFLVRTPSPISGMADAGTQTSPGPGPQPGEDAKDAMRARMPWTLSQ